MKIEDRIVYDGSELIRMLESFLDRMKAFTFDGRYSALLGEGLIEKITTWDKTIRRQKDMPLTLTVCGEFKRGKSSLINALLGEEVVTTNITTETITTNRISYGPHKNELIMSGGRRIPLRDDELCCDKLKAILEELSEPARELELKRPIEILRRMTVIDTPGLGDAMADFLPDVKAALKQSDAVIYVFSTLYPLSMQEKLFIKNVIKPQKYTELLLVSNFTDALDDIADCTRVSDVIRERMEDLLPDETPIMLSALDERCRQIGAKQPNDELAEYLGENFTHLREQLDRMLTEKREYVIPNRVHRLISSMTSELMLVLDALMQGVTISADELDRKTEALIGYQKEQDAQRARILARIDTLISDSEGRTVRVIDEMLDKMEKEADTLSRYSVEDVKRYYSMYCTETLQAGIERCVDQFTVNLHDTLDTISSDMAHAFSSAGVTVMPSFKFALQNKSWTKGDNVAFVGNLALSGHWLSYISDYVAGSMRRSEIKSSMADVITDIKVQFPALRSAAVMAVTDVYADIARSVRDLVSAHFDDQLATLTEQLEQAASIARQNDQKKEEIKAAVLEVKQVLDGIVTEMAISPDISVEE